MKVIKPVTGLTGAGAAGQDLSPGLLDRPFLPVLPPYLPDPRGGRGVLCVAGRISGTWRRKGLHWPGEH